MLRSLPTRLGRLLSTAAAASTSQQPPIVITKRAADQMKKIVQEGEHMRILVDSGGCSGFEYKLSIDRKFNEDDEVISQEGATVVIDRVSLNFVKGSKLDFTEDLMRSAFRIVDNPVAKTGCSCGASFAPKDIAG